MKNKLFAHRLKLLRSEKGISQIKLADEIDFTKGMVGQWESGAKNPSVESLKIISNYFNVSTDYLLGKSDFRDKEETATYILNRLKEEDLVKEIDGKVSFKDLDKLIENIKLVNKIKNT